MFGILKNERLSPLLHPTERTHTVTSVSKGQKSKTGFVFNQFIVFRCDGFFSSQTGINALHLGVPGFICTVGSDLSAAAHSYKIKH